MRSIVKKGGLTLGVFLLGLIATSQILMPKIDLNKKSIFMAGDAKRTFLGKSSAPFSMTKEFSWVDLSLGQGVVTVNLKGESFSHSQWHFRWRLPEGASTTQLQEQDLPAPSLGALEPLTLDVRGLNTNVNQNVILELSPTNGNDQNVVIIIPTHYEQTKEAEASAALNSQTKLSMQKTTSGEKRSRLEGIQF